MAMAIMKNKITLRLRLTQQMCIMILSLYNRGLTAEGGCIERSDPFHMSGASKVTREKKRKIFW
jgi:hypothetical protein